MTRPDLSDVVLTRGDRTDPEGMSITEAVAAHAGEQLRHPTQRPSCASPVLIEWMIAWADRLNDDDRQQLRQYVLPLTTSRGTPDQETARVWLVIDWLIRANAPLWFHAVQLSGHANAVASLYPVRYPQDFAEAYSTVRDAARASRDVSENLWRLVAEDAQLTVLPAQPHHVGNVPAVDFGPYEPAQARRLETWAAVADATTTAIQAAETLVDCATCAAGYRTATEDEMPQGLRAITHAIAHSAAGIAWRAVSALTKQDTWSWETPPDAVSTATTTAVRSALGPTELAVRELAHDLTGRML